MTKRNTTHKILWIAIILVIFPVLLTLYLYPLKERKIADGYEYQQHEIQISKLLERGPGFKDTLAEIFEINSHLGWYVVSIYNHTIEEDPNCIEKMPAMTRFQFIKGDPRSYDTNLTENDAYTPTGIYKYSYPVYQLKSGENIYFVASPNEEYSINGGLSIGGDCLTYPANFNFDNYNIGDYNLQPNYEVVVKPLMSSWLARLMIIWTFILFVFSSLLSTIGWVSKSKND